MRAAGGDLRRYGFVAATVVALIAAAAKLGAHQAAPASIAASMIATTIAVATPLTLGALCGIFCERAGVINIGIEGTMLTAAFFGWFGALYASSALHAPPLPSLLAGLALAVASGAATGLLHAALAVSFEVDHIIAGTVVNLLAAGLTGFLSGQLSPGPHSPLGAGAAGPGVLPRVRLWPLSELPAVGVVFDQQPVAIAAVALVFVAHFVLFSTRWGLRARAAGEHPGAAAAAGVDVARVRYLNVVVGGAIAGLGGAYFTLESVPSFEPMMTNGRGFIALAAVIFGNWRPAGALAAASVFGAAQAFQINLQLYRDAIPPGLAFLQQSSIVGSAPYLLTLLILTGVVGKTAPPSAGGAGAGAERRP